MEIHWADENLEFAFFTLNCKLNYYINTALFFVIPLLLSYLNLFFICFLLLEWLNFYMHTKIASKLQKLLSIHQLYINPKYLLIQINIFQFKGK
jgi:hypothetical protein